ncbi:unnamed protein product [Lota lota]
MRRKTVAKRLLDLQYESEEEDKERECIHANKEVTPNRHSRGERVYDLPSHFVLPIFSFKQSLGSLQSCSRATLIAMVMSMQKEMDSLREQIRCLTASGKLASTLESLLQRTEQWSSSSSITTTPMKPTDKTLAPAVLGRRDKAGVFSSSCQKQNGNYCQDHHQTTPKETLNGGPQCPPSPLYQELIPAELLKSCNTGTTAQKLTNDLLRGLYDRDCLASHSISGLVNSKKGPSKPALPGDQIQAILRAVKHYFPGKTDSEIKGYIRQKLQNEAKRLRKKPLPLSTKEEEPVRRGEGLITYA